MCICGELYYEHSTERQGLNILPALIISKIQGFLSLKDDISLQRSIQLFLPDSGCHHQIKDSVSCVCFHHIPVDHQGIITILDTWPSPQ